MLHDVYLCRCIILIIVDVAAVAAAVAAAAAAAVAVAVTVSSNIVQLMSGVGLVNAITLLFALIAGTQSGDRACHCKLLGLLFPPFSFSFLTFSCRLFAGHNMELGLGAGPDMAECKLIA